MCALYIGVWVLGAIVIFPVIWLSIGGGFIFTYKLGDVEGFLLAYAVILTSAYVSVILVFFISRYCFREFVKAQLDKRNYKFQALDIAIQEQGWRLLILIRCTPFPYTMLNYVAGATSVSLTDNLIGCAPIWLKIAYNIYIGASLKMLHEYHSNEDPTEDDTAKLVYMAIGLLVGIVALVLMSIYVKRRMAHVFNVSQPSPSKQVYDEFEDENDLSIDQKYQFEQLPKPTV